MTKNDHVRDVYERQDGKTFTVEANARLDETYNWRDMEKFFGIDEIDESDFKKWELENKDKKEVCEVIEILDTKAHVIKGWGGCEMEANDEMKSEGHGTGATDGRRKVEDGSDDRCDLVGRHGGATKKLGRRGRKKNGFRKIPRRTQAIVQSDAVPRQDVNGSECEMGRDSIPKGVECLKQQPTNRRGPGYERRAQRLQRQLGELTERVLCERENEWNECGGEIEQVVLSPNLRNLTIFYDVGPGERDVTRGWKKICEDMTGVIHAEIARQIDGKYVPRVHFERVGRLTRDEKEMDVEDLFERIAAERRDLNHDKTGLKAE